MFVVFSQFRSCSWVLNWVYTVVGEVYLGIYLVYTAMLSWDCPFANCCYWATNNFNLGSIWTIFWYCFGLGLVMVC